CRGGGERGGEDQDDGVAQPRRRGLRERGGRRGEAPQVAMGLPHGHCRLRMVDAWRAPRGSNLRIVNACRCAALVLERARALRKAHALQLPCISTRTAWSALPADARRANSAIGTPTSSMWAMMLHATHSGSRGCAPAADRGTTTRFIAA